MSALVKKLVEEVQNGQSTVESLQEELDFLQACTSPFQLMSTNVGNIINDTNAALTILQQPQQ